MAASSRALPGSCSAKLVVPDISVTGPVKRVRLAVSIDHTADRQFPCAHPGNAGLYAWPLPESASDTITAPPLEGRSDFYWRRSTEPCRLAFCCRRNLRETHRMPQNFSFLASYPAAEKTRWNLLRGGSETSRRTET